jgi:hypothetical protein
MSYNPIFEEEVEKEKEFDQLRKAIKGRASQDQFKDLCFKFSAFVKNHPVFTAVALGVFSTGLVKK